MVEFVQSALAFVRVLDKRIFERCTKWIQYDGNDGGLVDLGGRSSNVSKDECDDVVLWSTRFHRC